MAGKYESWPVYKLKVELLRRSAATHGWKTDLIERLKSYDRNQDFRGPSVVLPEPLDPAWPTSGFKQLRPEHRFLMPKLSKEQVEGYFVHRMAVDNLATADVKALEKGQDIFAGHRVLACSFYQQGEGVFLSGIVAAAMRHKVSYNFKLKIEKKTGEPKNSNCECPAGKGPHATCKHIAAALLMIIHFITTGDVQIEKCCTDNLQTFHKPKAYYNGSPVKAENIPSKRKHSDAMLEDPRPRKYRNHSGYNDHVRNVMINYCSRTSMDVALRYAHPKADIQRASLDHDYLQLPFTEYWIDQANKVNEKEAAYIEATTKPQSKCPLWFHHRKWRLTASRFGEIIHITDRRNKMKLCKSLDDINSHINSDAIKHGNLYESKSVAKFESLHGITCKRAGVFVHPDFPFLGASPDRIVGKDSLVEVKCTYSGRNEKIEPGKLFPFLTTDNNGNAVLKSHSNYYAQIQGQLFISKCKLYYFIVYTFEDMFVQTIPIDENYCTDSLLPKLSSFYERFFRPYFIASTL